MERVRTTDLGTCLPPLGVYKLLSKHTHAFLLESALIDRRIGRYSIVAFDPIASFKTTDLSSNLYSHQGRELASRGNPFDSLKKIFDDLQVTEGADREVPFIGGAVGYFGFELLHTIESVQPQRTDDLHLPECWFQFFRFGFVTDHVAEKTFLVGVDHPQRSDFDSEYRKWLALAASVEEDESKADAIGIADRATSAGKSVPSVSAEQYKAMVRKVKQYIAQGDVYQVCITYRIAMDYEGSPLRLYEVLRHINPAPFSCYLDYGDFQVIGSSPERFLKIDRAGVAQARPMKGTRPRGRDPESDRRLYRELRASEKDRAENLMIVDLLRNDLARTCEAGSVCVPRLFEIETYASVYQMVSTIEGRLRDDSSIFDCIQCCFPGGSMTGAPKVRAMEIIKELEPINRGIYSGAIGYLSLDGSVDLSIVIRTIIVKDGKAYFNVGGGIVYDSDPEAEYQESLDKAAALIRAVTYASHLSDSTAR